MQDQKDEKDEKDYWQKQYPKVERTKHPGPQPTDPTPEQMTQWNQARMTYNKSLFAERKHMVAVSVDEIAEVKSKSPVERIATILGVAYLRGEFSDRDDVNSFMGGLFGVL